MQKPSTIIKNKYYSIKFLLYNAHLICCNSIFKSIIQAFFCNSSNNKIWKLILYPGYITRNDNKQEYFVEIGRAQK